MTPDERQVWATANGFDASVLEVHLVDPRCGELTALDLAKFTSAQQASFSVGFVTVAAGVMSADRF